MTKAKHFRFEDCVEEASVSIGGIRYDLPVRKGTLGPAVVDITTLYQDTGRFTYAPQGHSDHRL